MSKIVFLGVPAYGHTNPTLPVVLELLKRGEQVTYYNTEEFRLPIEKAGATFRAYPPSELTARALTEAVQQGNLANASVLMLRTTETLLSFLLQELHSEHPDLVIFDSLAVWGKMATTILQLRAAASITHFVFDLKSARVTPREIWMMVRQGLPQVPKLLALRNKLGRHYGKAALPPSNPLFPMRDNMNLIFTARELHPNTALIDDTFHFVGPSINPQVSASNSLLETLNNQKLSEGQTVYISLGTVHDLHTEFYHCCFEAFGHHPAQFILSAGRESDIAALGAIPANFIVRPTVPQLEVLQFADVFITHGGINSVQEGLYYGVPLLVIPHQFEQLLNARIVETRGAAVVLKNQVTGGQVTAAELRCALETLMSQTSYREAATALQRILRSTGGYRQAADEIQTYIASEKK